MYISIEYLIHIYDTNEDKDVSVHISSLTGVIGEDLGIGLLKHYFNSIGYKVTRLSSKPRELLPEGENKNKGKRLDCWIAVENGEKKLYQTEIKNWSAHSIAGYKRRNLHINCKNEALIEFAGIKFTDQWSYIGDRNNDGLRYVKKVLKKMEEPTGYSDYQIEPLICYWYPIAPKDSHKPFNRIPCDYPHFKFINFFSMSLYIRKLYAQGDSVIEIDVPDIEKRLRYFEEIFPARS